MAAAGLVVTARPPDPPAWPERPGPAALAVLGLVVASFASLDLQLGEFLSAGNLAAAGRFVAELLHPAVAPAFVLRVGRATLETLAMSALGTALAALAGLMIARWAPAVRPVLNVLRSVPELVWASLLLISVGLGPFAGTLALALHTTGVLGRLYLEVFENLPPEPGFALRCAGASPTQVFCYAELPQALPQLVSYTIYRWENNIRAAAVLGVVGAGGLGQMLTLHLQLFQMGRAATVIVAILLLVAVVDAASAGLRRRLG